MNVRDMTPNILFPRLSVRRSWLRLLAFALLVQCPHIAVVAQTAPAPGPCTPAGSVGEQAAQPCLTTLVTTYTQYAFNGLEKAAAQADDIAYASLLPICLAGGCNAAQLNLFTRLRELEDNAAQLLGFGETQHSLNLAAQGLGFALRWTADEEFSAQSSLSSRFANNQLAAVNNRLTALRFLQTVRLAREDALDADGIYAANLREAPGSLGGGASADPESAQFGKWSAFANGAYGAGSRTPTTFNDAFSFGGTQLSAGADVRLSRQLVVGFLVNHLLQEADFDSSESIVGGRIEGTGWGATGYMQMDWDAAYLSVSLGAQRMALDSTRLVAYPSNNPQIASVNTTFSSSTDATSWLATVGSGYVFHVRGFSATPYLNVQFMHTTIDGFTESTSGADLGFGASVSAQSLTSLVGTAGLKFQYAFLPSFGVIVPYVFGEYHHEFRNPSQNVNSQFSPTTSGGDYFQLPTDEIKAGFYEVGGGFSTVLPHGAQLYLQYMKVLQLQYYTDYVASAGFRFEF